MRVLVPMLSATPIRRLAAAVAGAVTAIALVAAPAFARQAPPPRNHVTVAAGTSPASAAIPSTSDYPWAGLTYANGGDQWGMAYGQCVSYIAWMIYQNNGGGQHPPVVPDQGWFPSDGLAKSPVRYTWGNAGSWNISAVGAGFAVDRIPRVGSIAQWINGSDGGSFTVGHVAYVTAVYGDGSVDLAQYNLREDSRFSTLRLPPAGATDTSNGHGPFFVSYPDHFLHIYDTNPTGGQPYQVTGADSQGLAVQSQPHVNHVVRYALNSTTLYVSCQTKYGDQVDGRTEYGRPFTTWDRLTDGTYVYDWYMNTPTVATTGYSPGIPACPGG